MSSLAIFAAVIVGALRILGVVNGAEASDAALKAVGVLLFLGLGLGAASMMMSSKPANKDDKPKGQGPQF